MKAQTIRTAGLCVMLALALALAGCAGEDTSASASASNLSAGYQTASDAAGAGGDIDGSGRVHYGYMPDDDELLTIRTEDDQTTGLGKVPVIEPTDPQLLTVYLSGFATSREVFVSIDGSLIGAFPVEDVRAELQVTGSQLESGTHSVEACQYAGNDPTATCTQYKCCQYAVDG